MATPLRRSLTDRHLCRIGVGEAKVTYNTVSADGKLSEGTPIDVQRSQLMHDFGVTPNYAVFLDQNLVFNPQACHRTPPVDTFLACLL